MSVLECRHADDAVLVSHSHLFVNRVPVSMCHKPPVLTNRGELSYYCYPLLLRKDDGELKRGYKYSSKTKRFRVNFTLPHVRIAAQPLACLMLLPW